MDDLDPGATLLIALAGLCAGAINAIAGGGSLITFPALLAVGYSPLVANVTNTVSVLPGYIGGAVGYRRELANQSSDIRRLAPIAVLGSIVGSAALLTTSEDVLENLVPVLVLVAALLLIAQPRIHRWVQSRRHDGFVRSDAALQLSVTVVAAYGAYFGGGLGVMLLAVLGVFVTDRLQRANALKSILTLVINAVAMLAFALLGPVQWPAVAIVAPMSLAGGWIGASAARRMRPAALRGCVATFGVTVAIVLALV